MPELALLEEQIGYRFRDPSLLELALTHCSYAGDRPAPSVPNPRADNEELEFLGDAVLGMVVSEYIYNAYPNASEGMLSKAKSKLVSASWLRGSAAKLNLGSYLRLGRGEERSGGRDRQSILADTVEALIAALYLDGGLEAARQFINGHVLDLSVISGSEQLSDASSLDSENYIGELQEGAQARGLPVPEYVVVDMQGPEHARVFVVEVRMGNGLSAQGSGTSKKTAGQQAARSLGIRLRESQERSASGST